MCFHSVAEGSRRRRLEVGKLEPWAASLSLPPMEEEEIMVAKAPLSTKHFEFHVSLRLRRCP